MRAFFCSFLFVFSSVQYAQEKTDFESFNQKVLVLQEDLNAAKNRTIQITPEWVVGKYIVLQRLMGIKGELLLSREESVVEEVKKINFQLFVEDLRALNLRVVSEDAVQQWSMDTFDDTLLFAKRAIDQLDRLEKERTGGGLRFSYQPQQIGRSLLMLQILEKVLADKEFTSRVCPNGCSDMFADKKAEVIEYLVKTRGWVKRAENWQPTLPDPVMPKP